MNRNICILQNRFICNHTGGYEVQIYNICRALLSRGWNIQYIHQGKNTIHSTFDNIELYQIRERYFFNFYDPIAFKTLKSINPVIIYQRSRTGFSCGLIGRRYVKRYKNKKLIFSIGSLDDIIPFFLFKSLWKDKKNNFVKKILASPDTLIKDFLFQFNIREADLLISQNTEQQEACKKQYGRNSVIIRSIHPSVNKIIIKDSPPAICWIANARQVKQPELFLELIESLNDLTEKQTVRFIMVLGKNIHKYNETVMLNKLKLNPSVGIIGELSIDEANRIMEKSSILINTSVYEGFSNTFIQAWLRETPVVSLNSDPDDIIKNFKIGFHSGSMVQMKKDVRFLIENPDEMMSMGKRARSYAEEHHNIEKIADQINNLFTKLIYE